MEQEKKRIIVEAFSIKNYSFKDKEGNWINPFEGMSEDQKTTTQSLFQQVDKGDEIELLMEGTRYIDFVIKQKNTVKTNQEIGNTKDKHVVDIKGNKFITFAGLLERAYDKGLNNIRITELNVDWENQSAYCIAACKIGDREIMGAGSGTKENCNNMVAGHFVEMAQTRAFARCLRTALNIDMVSKEELKE